MRKKPLFYLLALGLALLLTLSGSLRAAYGPGQFVWHPDAPVWLVLQIVAITALLDWLHRRQAPTGAAGPSYFLRLLALGGGVWLAGTEVLEFTLRLLPGTRPHEWGWYPLLRSMLLVFLYQRHLGATRAALAEAEQAAHGARLQALQQHVDPHFLFNNLNILGALIEPTNEAAHEYVAHLASLYRYLVRTREQEAVPVAEELAFARDYQALLRRRFGAAYQFEEQLDASDAELRRLLLPPGVLQELLANAVKHNLASRAQPLWVQLHLTPTALVVRNARQPRPQPASGEGSGLASLRARFALLADVPVLVEQTEAYFAVTLPLTPGLAPAHAPAAA